MDHYPTALFSDLEEDLSDHLCLGPSGFVTAGDLDPSASDIQYACSALRDSFYKKAVFHESVDAESKCIEKWTSSNARAASWSPEPVTWQDEFLLGEFRREIRRLFGPLQDHWTFGFDGMPTGPGTARGARGTDFYTKWYDSPLGSTSDGLYTDYLRYRGRYDSPHSVAESKRSAKWGVRLYRGDKLTTVPKDSEIRRSITIGPSLNVSAQLQIGQKFAECLRMYHRIDLTDQPDYNRVLARFGSLYGNFATLDLKDASNSISSRLIEWSFLENGLREVYSWMAYTRSPTVQLPNGEVVVSNIWSGMGNGFTFPLQTAIFSCVVRAVYKLLNRPALCRTVLATDGSSFSPATYGVFGDDIACETSSVSMVVRLLHLLGFTVNTQKSFSEGPFRESCGHDYRNGKNVRGVYIKRLTTPQDLCVAFNTLVRWSLRHKVPLTRTLTSLRRRAQKLGAPVVPPYESDDAGLKLPYKTLTKKVWDNKGCMLYRAYVPSPFNLVIKDGWIKGPRWYADLDFNEEGLLDTLLQGALRGDRIAIRGNAVNYRLASKRTPNWDSTSTFRERDRDTVPVTLWFGDEPLVWIRFLQDAAATGTELDAQVLADMDSLLWLTK